MHKLPPVWNEHFPYCLGCCHFQHWRGGNPFYNSLRGGQKCAGDFCCVNFGDFAGDFPGGFFWSFFPQNEKSGDKKKKSGGPKMKIREKSVLPKAGPKTCLKSAETILPLSFSPLAFLWTSFKEEHLATSSIPATKPLAAAALGGCGWNYAMDCGGRQLLHIDSVALLQIGQHKNTNLLGLPCLQKCFVKLLGWSLKARLRKVHFFWRFSEGFLILWGAPVL